MVKNLLPSKLFYLRMMSRIINASGVNCFSTNKAKNRNICAVFVMLFVFLPVFAAPAGRSSFEVVTELNHSLLVNGEFLSQDFSVTKLLSFQNINGTIENRAEVIGGFFKSLSFVPQYFRDICGDGSKYDT